MSCLVFNKLCQEKVARIEYVGNEGLGPNVYPHSLIRVSSLAYRIILLL